MADMEFRTITVVFVEQDEQWCNYVMKNFNNETLKLNIHTLNVSNLGSHDNPPELETAVRESYVTMLLATSYFLDYMEDNATWLVPMLKRGDPDVTTIVCALLHITDEEITDVSSKHKYNLDSWTKLEIDVSGKNIKECASQVLGIADTNTEKRKSKNSGPDMKRRPSTSVSPKGPVELVPSAVHEPGERVAVLFSEEVKGTVTVVVSATEVPTCPVNPYCVTFITPDAIIGKDPIRIQVNVDNVRFCRLRLENKGSIPQFTSVELMCQAFRAHSTKELDKKLAERFLDSRCYDGRAMEIFEDLVTNHTLESITTRSKVKYPTVMHWAAANGLEELCSSLLEAPGAGSACLIDNCNGEDPADLARNNGHHELSDLLMDFSETKEMADTCDLYVRTCSIVPGTTTSQGEDLYETMTAGGFGDRPTSLPLSAPPKLPPRDIKGRTDSITEEEDENYVVPDPILPGCAVGSRSQAELVEIQEEVKRGNFSIEQAEMLLNAWKARYESGNAVSFKDRQRALKAIQDEHKKAMSALRNMTTKKNKKKAATSDPSQTVTNISDPILIRQPVFPSRFSGGSIRGSGRGSTTSIMSNVSRDSGRDSSQLDDLELEQGENVIRRNSGARHSSNRSPEDRKSMRDLYLELTPDLPTEPPPALPPRPKPSSRTYSKPKTQTPPAVATKPQMKTLKSPKR